MAETKLFRFRLAGEPFGKHRRADGTLKLLVPKLQSDGPPLTVLNPETGDWDTTTIETFEKNVTEGPLGERIRVKTPLREFEVYSLWRPWLYLGQLPSQSTDHNWREETRSLFRWAMWRECDWLGSYVRRRSRHDPKEWSQHSWPDQAHDFAPKDTARGDKSVKEGRKRFGKFLFVWEAPNHRGATPEHFHVEHDPKQSGTPPLSR